MTRHEIVVDRSIFCDILSGRRTFHLEKTQPGRNIWPGDELWLRERSIARAGFTGRSVVKQVLYVIDSEDSLLPQDHTGLVQGWVLMSIGPSLSGEATL